MYAAAACYQSTGSRSPATGPGSCLLAQREPPWKGPTGQLEHANVRYHHPALRCVRSLAPGELSDQEPGEILNYPGLEFKRGDSSCGTRDEKSDGACAQAGLGQHFSHVSGYIDDVSVS